MSDPYRVRMAIIRLNTFNPLALQLMLGWTHDRFSKAYNQVTAEAINLLKEKEKQADAQSKDPGREAHSEPS